MTNNLYLDNKASESTEIIESHNYVKKITIPITASSTKKIIFYKADTSEDYSYDGKSGTRRHCRSRRDLLPYLL